MKTTSRNITLLMLVLGLSSCSFSLQSRSIASGISELDAMCETYLRDDVPTLATDGTSLLLSITEKYKDHDTKDETTKSSFYMSCNYSRLENGYSIFYCGGWDNDNIAYAIKNGDGKCTYLDGKTERDALSSDPFNIVNDFNWYLVDNINYPLAFMFRGYLNSVYGKDDQGRGEVLTGCSVSSASSDSWMFELYSDYREYDETEGLGFSERDYSKFFTNSKINWVPAYYISMKTIDGKVTSFNALYSYEDEELESTVQGNVEMRIVYGQ